LIGDGRFRGEADMHNRVASTSAVATGPLAVIGWIEIPQRSSLLLYRAVLWFEVAAQAGRQRVEDYVLAEAVWREAIAGWPEATIILRQGARVVHDSRRPRAVK
jgi:hypothetical protein